MHGRLIIHMHIVHLQGDQLGLDYISMTFFWEFCHVANMPYQFCHICTQVAELPNQSQQIVVPDLSGHPVDALDGTTPKSLVVVNNLFGLHATRGRRAKMQRNGSAMTHHHFD